MTIKIVLLFMVIVTLPACSLEPIKPWERHLLAEPQMRTVPDPIDSFFDAHIYFSKEASSGGQGVGGGGCGCN